MAHDFSAPSTTAPRRAYATRATAVDDARLPGSQPHKFILAHHPTSWEFDETHGYLPRIQRCWLRPGVNGVSKGPSGHQVYISRLRSDGWTVLDEGMEVRVSGDDGEIVAAEGYLYEVEGQAGPHYIDAWSRPVITGVGRNRRVDWQTAYDRAGYNAWRAFVLRDGAIVAPPDAGVIADLCKRQGRRASRRQGEAHAGNPHIQAIVKEELEKLASMRDAAASAKAAPKRKRQPKRAKGAEPVTVT